MNQDDAAAQMQEDWNRRAREDAHYYVAFGRRGQDDDEFFASADGEVQGLERELKRLPAGRIRARRALEIGCGLGRLMRPLSRHFGEIHGVDVSDEMVLRAKEKLAGIPHAHVHHTPDSTLSAFADDSFDFVYSYAVFQHIPSRSVVFGYLREAYRVVKPGGLIRCQMNGLMETPDYDTWKGVRIAPAEIREFATRNDLDLLTLERIQTQYMWVTFRKPAEPLHVEGAPPVRIRQILNTHSTEPIATVRGRYSAIAAMVENLPPRCDLNRMRAFAGGQEADISYIGWKEQGGLQPIGIALPHGLRTGLHPLLLTMNDVPLCPEVTLRLLPPGPALPYLVFVRDGIDLCSGTRVVSGTVKVAVEEVERPDELRVAIGPQQLKLISFECTNPRLLCYEFNYQLPQGLQPGRCELALSFRAKPLANVEIEVAAAATGSGSA